MTPFIRKSIANEVNGSPTVYSKSLETVLTQGDLVYDKENKVLYHFDGHNELKRLSNTLSENEEKNELEKITWDLGNYKVTFEEGGKVTSYKVGDMTGTFHMEDEEDTKITHLDFNLDYSINEAEPWPYLTMPDFYDGKYRLYFLSEQEVKGLVAQLDDLRKRVEALENRPAGGLDSLTIYGSPLILSEGDITLNAYKNGVTMELPVKITSSNWDDTIPVAKLFLIKDTNMPERDDVYTWRIVSTEMSLGRQTTTVQGLLVYNVPRNEYTMDIYIVGKVEA